MVIPLKQPIVFELEGFFIPLGYSSLLFFLALLNYMVVLLGNGVAVCIIVMDKSLHRPMFVMVCNLLICDLLGGTAVLPCLMVHFLTGDRRITYVSAIIQAICMQTYGAAMQTVLGIMAYDRYVAVCEPLQYHTIMTSARLHSCCVVAWLVALMWIAVLFSFHANVPLCSSTIQHIYCSNRAILSLACITTPENDIYGMSMFWCAVTMTFFIIAYSYIRILQASLRQGRADVGIHSKALQSCGSNLVVYVLYEVASLIIIVSQRLPSLSPNVKKFCSIMFVIVPPAINPIVYGLVSKELHASIFRHFTLKLCHKNGV